MKSGSIRFFAITICFLFSNWTKEADTGLSISQIKCGGFNNPTGTVRVPDFSWILKAEKKSQIQTAYQIIIGSNQEKTARLNGDVWNSGKVISGETTLIPFSGTRLQPGTEYFWRVRVWDKNDIPTIWSYTAKFVTGLFEKNDWSNARWIGFEDIPDSLLLVPGVHGDGDNLGNIARKRTTVPYFRKDFSINKKITGAYVFVSGLGQYELYINGNKIGNHFLAPGWSDYRKTCFYNSFDVTENLKQGINTVATIVGNGFYNINRERYRKLVIAYGAPKMILKLEVHYSDGSKKIIVSDESWKTSPSPITFTSIYGGEDWDARLEQDGWNKPGFQDESWKKVLLPKEPAGVLRPETDWPVTISEATDFKTIPVRKDSISVYDFGQNAAGIIKVRIRGNKGQKVRFTPGELLGEDSLVTQQATGGPYFFSCILKGKDEEVWMPRFTYYGFRYVQVNGAIPAGNANPDHIPVIEDIQFLHTGNSSPQIGSFKCSNELLNSIYSLINWSIKSNLASVATDCPHREKLGWLEQTHLMGNSVKFVYDIHNLFNKIIDDMIEAQLDNGLVPDIAPEYVPFVDGFRDSPEWGSACIILPWDMLQWYGDTKAIRKAYPMMKKYFDHLNGMAVKNILYHGLGDWYDLGPKFPGEAQLTPKSVTATSVFFYDAKLLGEMAKLIGEKEDADFFRKKAEEIRLSFNSMFYNPLTQVYSTGSQTAYSMPLYFGMVDEIEREDVIRNLIKTIKDNNNALTAGDIGYRYLLRVLEEARQSQLIFEMNSKTDVPGYGYQLSKGATSLTESWAALKYVSNNHMMLGHLMEWFFSGIGGIRQESDSKSYEKILIYPEIVGDLTWAETVFNSEHGEIATSWKIEADKLIVRVKIPVNCKAFVAIPQEDPDKVMENNQPVRQSKDIENVRVSSGRTLCEISSGEYIFQASFNKLTHR
jgi:alpha-L-rhamnosidase